MLHQCNSSSKHDRLGQLLMRIHIYLLVSRFFRHVRSQSCHGWDKKLVSGAKAFGRNATFFYTAHLIRNLDKNYATEWLVRFSIFNAVLQGSRGDINQYIRFLFMIALTTVPPTWSNGWLVCSTKYECQRNYEIKQCVPNVPLDRSSYDTPKRHRGVRSTHHDLFSENTDFPASYNILLIRMMLFDNQYC